MPQPFRPSDVTDKTFLLFLAILNTEEVDMEAFFLIFINSHCVINTPSFQKYPEVNTLEHFIGQFFIRLLAGHGGTFLNPRDSGG